MVLALEQRTMDNGGVVDDTLTDEGISLHPF